MAYTSRFKTGELERGVCIYTDRGGTQSISDLRDHASSPGGTGGICGGGVASFGGGASETLHLQCLRILCCSILVRMAANLLIFINHCWVSLHCSLHLFMPRRLNSPHHLFSDFGARFLDEVLHFLCCGMWKLSWGHLYRIQGKAHVGLFLLYLTSLPCHSSWHLENLQEISCCSKSEI